MFNIINHTQAFELLSHKLERNPRTICSVQAQRENHGDLSDPQLLVEREPDNEVSGSDDSPSVLQSTDQSSFHAHRLLAGFAAMDPSR